ncbi:MAG: hypothetical protein PVF50_09835 [Gammaproteobacteria bacterium]|jgi:hypothetical protein
MIRLICTLSAAVVLATLAPEPGAARVVGETPEFEDGSKRPVSIALLPPQASVATQRLVTAEAQVDESLEFAIIYTAQIAALLEEQGYLVEIIDADRVNADPRLQEYVVDANRRYDELLQQVRPRRIKKRLYNAGDEARALANHLNVDALGFPRLTVVGATGGKIAMSVLLGGSMGGSFGTLSLVDGHSGDLEAHLVGPGGNSARKFDEDPDGMIGRITDNLVKGLPNADPSARVEPETDDEDVLAEIESLLNE